METKMIDPVKDAAINVISTMAMINPKPGEVFLKSGKKATGDISGVIGLAGVKKGVIIISFSSAAICKIVGGMLGMEYTSIDQDVSDAVGELTNMISGDSRRRFNELGFVFEAGLPTVIKGPGHEIESVTSGPVLAIPFQVDGHGFEVEVSFDD
ncbi:MAG: chemotaxis protein CheX [Nitrospinota bacterium]|nr:chemotaxis protein CheX [Nitrospinota bacterium]